MHGHAADMAVGQQSARAHRWAVRPIGHGMHRHRIVVIQLDLRGHSLFDDEHLVANRVGIFAQPVPRTQRDTHR
ncbi:hypothetical protein G6F40_017937 [Rhizopus arrhizus]|nr:hypothetical protein G6F40_017937 [Rhizopus arrhizus]